MKRFLVGLLLPLTFACLISGISNAQQSETPLTNAAVVKLVRAGFKEKTVIAIVRNRPNRFNLEPDRLIELKRSGVSENIILAMLGQSDSFVFDDDDWMDESRDRVRGANGGQSNGVDIFGSGSHSNNQTSGRGLNAGSSGETTTTGSATVRILRPPSEPGGESPKLERTPTLTNEAVIKLVEAGFSEGTIIKRIEDSPAEFDLSTAKLEELRRRRVTDGIITAMMVAMGNDPSTAPKSKGTN
jgi:hypothetical protein